MKRIILNFRSLFLNRQAKISAKKTEIRQKIKELKVEISEAQKQQEVEAVFNKIELLPEFYSSKTILLYWSIKDELPTHEIVEKWSSSKQIVLPTVIGDDLVLKKYTTNGLMKQGALGIQEPDSSENFEGKVDLVIVPGVAFDKLKNRLGRGKGYYDRFFANNNSIKIGVGFDFQLLEYVPVSRQDIQMDKVITSSKTIE